MPQIVWKDIKTGMELFPPVDASQTEVDLLIGKIELGEEIWLRPKTRSKLNLVVVAVDTSKDVTTLLAQLV